MTRLIGLPVSRAFIGSLLLAVGMIIQDHRNPETWNAALAVVAAALSGGAVRNGSGRTGEHRADDPRASRYSRAPR